MFKKNILLSILTMMVLVPYQSDAEVRVKGLLQIETGGGIEFSDGILNSALGITGKIGPQGIPGEVGPKGDTGPQGPANQLAWVVVNSTSQVATDNTGYIAMNDFLTTITLPANPSIGSVIRVAGPGAGGWTLALNAGQYITGPDYILPPSAMGVYWVSRENQRNWTALASSSDGVKLVAVATNSQIFISSDSGATWTPKEIVVGEGPVGRSWKAVASSSDGSKLAAAVYGGLFYTSSDSGTTWLQREILAGEGVVNRSWISLATSSDGTKLLAAVQNGQLYTSSDSGATWLPPEVVYAPVAGANWQAVASSSDGTKLVAITKNAPGGGDIYKSADSGVSWTPLAYSVAGASSTLIANWEAVASSSDGTKMIFANNGGQIYTSSDGGVTLIAQNAAGTKNWSAVASSSDGTKLIVAEGLSSISRNSGGAFRNVPGPNIYTSADSGATWTKQVFAGSAIWTTVTSSADGSKLAAASSYSTPMDVGRIYTNTQIPVVSGQTIVGGQTSAVELLYVGGGQFITLNEQGLLVRNPL